MESVSLFSNCGAGDVGFRKAGFQFRVMAELEAGRLQVALRNHPEACGIEGDLRETWPRVLEAWNEASDSSPVLLAACPPCQGMSTARSDRGDEDDPAAGSRDERNLLVVPIAEVAQALEPTFIVVENVPAFLRRKVPHPATGEGVSAARLLIALLSEHYRAFPFVSNLADYGVPQNRTRSFLTLVRRGSRPLARLEELRAAPYPVPQYAPENGGTPVSLDQALRTYDLGSLDAADDEGARASDDEPLHFVPVWKSRQYQMVAAIPPRSGASAWENSECPRCHSLEDDEDAATCSECGETLLRPVVDGNDGPRLVRGFRRSSYHRMAPDEPAATVTTASGRVGSSNTIHPWENRVLSPMECALLQTLPADFDWGDALEEEGVLEVRAMIGEAVPPRFTRSHGEVLNALLGDDTDRALLAADDSRIRRALRQLDVAADELQ